MRVELDSHADTSVFGDACLEVYDTGIRVSVEPFKKGLSSIKAPIVSVAVAYVCPTSNQVYILFFHQVLKLSGMTHHLLSPFQVRDFGITVNEVALHHVKSDVREPTHHSIIVEEPPLQIPLSLKGVMSGFLTGKPTHDEVHNPHATKTIHVHMTSDAPWDPQSKIHSENEAPLRAQFDQETQPLHVAQVHLRGQDSTAPFAPFDDDDPAEDDDYFSVPFKDSKSKGTEGTTAEEATCATASVTTVSDTDDDNSLAEQFLPEDQARTVIEGLDFMDHEQQSIASTSEFDLVVSALHSVGRFLANGEPTRKVAALSTAPKRKGFISPEKLAKHWMIPLPLAKRTVRATTQLAVRDLSNVTGTKRLKPHAWMLHYRRSKCKAYTDTLHAGCLSMRGNKYAQVFTTEAHTVSVYPLKSKKDAHQSLPQFFSEFGVPRIMVTDNAGELTEGEFLRQCRKVVCPIKPIEPHTPNQNAVEGEIRELKRLYRKMMATSQAPACLWDDCLELAALIRSHLALNVPTLEGEVPMTKLTGDTADISFISEFQWYQWVWYISPQDSEGEGSMTRKRLGRYLGPAKDHGDALCAKILSSKGKRVMRTSVFHLSKEDENSDEIAQLKQRFTAQVTERVKKSMEVIKEGKPDPLEGMEPYSDLKELDIFEPEKDQYEDYEGWTPEELHFTLPPGEDEEKKPLPELADAEDLDLNKYISAKVSLPQGGEGFANGIVVGRAKDENGELIGKSHRNPILDTSVYEVQFEDGVVDRYTANQIAEHIYSQIDGEGYGKTYLEEITDHRCDINAVPKERGWVYKDGRKYPCQTTKGWFFECKFKDNTTKWLKLKELKEANPVELAEYVKGNQLEDQPAFRWWVPKVLKKRDRIISAISSRYHRTTQKFGIEIPKTVERALEIDKETGTTFWRDAIEKEMKTVMVAFEFLEDGQPVPVGHRFIRCHMVFDVKSTLQRKARFVADGSRLEPEVPSYASVVSRESVRLAFLLAALNDLDVWAADCEGAYLNAKPKEPLYTKCGAEFGEHRGKMAVIVRALYGSKTAAAAWRAAISEQIESMGFAMCRGDNDVWMRRGKNTAAEDVWEYVLRRTLAQSKWLVC